MATQLERLKAYREAQNPALAALSHIQMMKGEPGTDGIRGSQFLGYFKSEKDLPNDNLVKGDFAIVGEKGTLWYIV